MIKLYKDIEEVRLKHVAAGGKFFEKITSDNECTRVESYLVAGCFFVTSELAPNDERSRLYSIRKVDVDIQIYTVGEYQQFATINEALEAIYLLCVEESHE